MQTNSKIPLGQGDNPLMPAFLKRYFWDTDFSSIDPQKFSTYVIERILDLGDMDAIKWLKEEYSQKDITSVVKHTRRLSHKSANFWTIIYNLNPKEVLCMTKSFREKHRQFWRF